MRPSQGFWGTGNQSLKMKGTGEQRWFLGTRNIRTLSYMCYILSTVTSKFECFYRYVKGNEHKLSTKIEMVNTPI